MKTLNNVILKYRMQSFKPQDGCGISNKTLKETDCEDYILSSPLLADTLQTQVLLQTSYGSLDGKQEIG